MKMTALRQELLRTGFAQRPKRWLPPHMFRGPVRIALASKLDDVGQLDSYEGTAAETVQEIKASIVRRRNLWRQFRRTIAEEVAREIP